jgi:GNAT superfamily N-acetyltransferase
MLDLIDRLSILRNSESMNPTQQVDGSRPAAPSPAGAALRPRPAPVARLRRASAQDTGGLTEMLAGLSLTSAWFRFLAGVRRPSPQLVARLMQQDATHGAWLAIVGEAPVGHVMWALGDDAAELGVVVTDAWQEHGIGRWLVQTALAEAAVAGATSVRLDVHSENRRALALVRQALPNATVTREAELLTFQTPMSSPMSAAATGCAFARSRPASPS